MILKTHMQTVGVKTRYDTIEEFNVDSKEISGLCWYASDRYQVAY